MTLPMNRREMLMTLGATAGALASYRVVRAQEGQPHPLGRSRTYEWKKPGWPVTAAIMGAGNRCDNDVVDNQMVNIEFGDISAAFSMEGLTSYAGRRTRVMGTRGDRR